MKKPVGLAARCVQFDSTITGHDRPGGTRGDRDDAVTEWDDEAESKRVFDALADGGEITGPFGPTFWSRGFGMCTDRFGVPWMVDTAGEPAAG